MQSLITRLALFQFLTVVYSILGIGLLVKMRFGSPAPVIFATHLRDYGFILLLLPATWLLWAGIAAHRPLKDTGDYSSIMVWGFGVLCALLILAPIGTFSALAPEPLVQVAPRP